MGRRRLMGAQARSPRQRDDQARLPMMDYLDRPDTVKVTVTVVFAPGMV